MNICFIWFLLNCCFIWYCLEVYLINYITGKLSLSDISRTVPITIGFLFMKAGSMRSNWLIQRVVRLTGLATCWVVTKWPYLYLWMLTALLLNSLMRMQLSLFLLNLECTIINLVSIASIIVSLMFKLIGDPNMIPTNFLFLAILTPIKIDCRLSDSCEYF